jgi:hypothetical protein
MTGETLLQLFVLVQVFLIGFLATIVLRHGYVHFWPGKRKPGVAPMPPDEVLSPAVKERVAQTAQAHFQNVLDQSVEQLHKDLEVTTQHINNLVMRVASEIVSGELERYRGEFSQLHQKAAADMGAIKDELAKHRAELEAKLAKEVEVERQRLIEQIDTKLGDAVASFLLETLQHNVDLGNQGAYLVSLLEEHKADFKKEVADESTPAK